MKFGADIHGSQRMNPKIFGDSLSFHLVPPAGQRFFISCEISQLLNWLKILHVHSWSPDVESY